LLESVCFMMVLKPKPCRPMVNIALMNNKADHSGGKPASSCLTLQALPPCELHARNRIYSEHKYVLYSNSEWCAAS
jgi:hypothetical protein